MKRLLTLFVLLALFLGAKAEWNQVYSIDYSTYQGFPFYVMGYVPEFDNGCMTDFGANYRYETQANLDDDGDLKWRDGESSVGTTMTPSGTEYEKVTGAGPYWHQYFIADGIKTKFDGKYKVIAKVKASATVNINVNMGWSWSENPASASVSIPGDADFQEVEWEYEGINGTSCYLVAQPGTCTETIEWLSLVVYEWGKDGGRVPEWLEDIENGDAETPWENLGLANIMYNDMENNYKICAWSKEKGHNMNEDYGWDPFPTNIEVDPTDANNHVFVVHGQPATTEGDASAWDNMLFIQSKHAWKSGQTLKIKFRYRCDYTGGGVKTNTQMHKQTPFDYLIWHAIGDITFTNKWQTFDNTMVIQDDMAGSWSIAFNLNASVKDAVNFYFDDLSWQYMKLDEGYFLSGINSTVTKYYDNLDNAIPFEATSATDYEATIGTKGDASTYVDQLMVSTTRGDDQAFKGATLKPTGKIHNDPDEWLDYAASPNGKIDIPGLGVWKVYIDTKYKAMAFEMLEGTPYENDPVDVFTYSDVITVNGLEREYTEAEAETAGIEKPENPGQAWDNQFFIKANRALQKGEVTKLVFKYKSSLAKAKTTTQCHGEYPGAYLHWAAIGDVTFTDEWQLFEKEFTVPNEADGMWNIAFNMAEIKEACDYYIKDIQWYLYDGYLNEGQTYENLINAGGTANFFVKEGAGTEPIQCDGDDTDIVWTIAGSSENIFGTTWDPTNTSNDMRQIEPGVYLLEKKNVRLEEGVMYEYKVVGNHSWGINYGADGVAGGENIEFSVDKSGVYNVWFYFYPDNDHQLTCSYEYVSGLPVQETIYFDNYSGVYFDGSQTIAGNYTNVLFAQGQSSKKPYGKGSYIYFYPGNTMTLTSDLDIVQAEFNTYYWMGSYVASSGTISDYTWRGNTSELTIASPTDESTNRFYSITVTLKNPSQGTLLERLTAQLEATTTALAGLTYAVPGKAELETLATEAATATSETDAAQLNTYIKQLREQTAAVIALDGKYKTLATLAAAVATTAEGNPYADATILAEASALVQEVEAGLLACAYTAAQVDPLIATLTTYNQQLADIYLTIHVEDAGSLGDLVLEKGVDFGDVVGLRVSGKLNTADQTTLKGFNKLQLIDLKETNLATLTSEQFRDKTTLKKAILPKNAINVGYNAFNNCTALEEVELPATLQTIDSYAFYNCRSLQSITFPEGLTSIGYEAFRCESNGYYDEQGNWSYSAGSLKEVTLPSTLTSLESYAFAYQTQLEKVTILDGLTYISENAFYNCSSLSDLTLPATLTGIGGSAFSNCSALTKLELPESLQTINYNAFGYCNNLEDVVLPSTLQYVYRPFNSCEKLTKMTIKAIAAPATNGYSIMGNATLAAACTLYVPELSINVYKQALNWNEFNIEGADIMPENITINTDYRLNWPENLALDYRPNIYVASNASLWVSGNSVLSAGNFTLAYSYNDASNNSWWNSDLQRYEYNRDNCFAALLNHAQYARADKVSIDAYTQANRWDFMSMPFDMKVSEIGLMFAETPYAIRKYDGAKRAQGLAGETWVNVDADETIPAGQGFILQSASTDGNRYYNGFTFNAINNANKNNIFANDDVAVELAEYSAEFEHNRSWNFIGNPYPAYFDIRAIQTTAPITVWDNYNQNYQAYSPVDDAYILNPGQAFFIQRPIDDDKATLVFQKQGRQIDMEIRPAEDVANRAPMINERSVFNLTVNGNEMSDRTRFVINNSAQMEYEAGRDANKFMSDEQSIQLYTIENGVQFAINERPLGNAVIELGLMVSKTGSYSITLNTTVDNEVYLIDRLTGMEVRIDGIEGGYTFDVEQGTIEGRFAIRLGLGDVTGIKSIERDFNNGENYYDLQGRKIDQPAKGVYINNGKKVVVR